MPNLESIADAENDGVAYCSGDSQDSACLRHLDNGFIRAVAVTHSDDSAWVQVYRSHRIIDHPHTTFFLQVTGCIDPSKSHLDPSDDGGQFDVRFPNGAQCSFGGYGASFIEQYEKRHFSW